MPKIKGTSGINVELLIREAIREQVFKVLDEEVDKAIKELSRRVGESVDQVTLNVLRYYQIEEMGNVIRIEVKKEL